MNKRLLEVIEGTVENIFIPEVYEDGGFVDESFNKLLGFNVKTSKGDLKIIEQINDINLSFYVGDLIKINKYEIICDYGNYNKKIKQLIDLYCSDYTDKAKENECNKYYIPIERYNINPKPIIEYEIIGK